MILPSLPDECFCDVLTFLDRKSLYKCLFVNRYYCKLSIPIIWRNPFSTSFYYTRQFSLINTLLACLNENEISSLIPCAINFNNQSPLFEYGSFIRKIDHNSCAKLIKIWLKTPFDQDCRVQKLVNAIYHVIMRQGSNLQELKLGVDHLPKFSILTTYKPGIKNLRSIEIMYIINYQDVMKFLSMVPKFNGIVNFILHVPVIFYDYSIKMYTKKIIDALEFQSETLKELEFDHFNFQGIDLSFISRLECLEKLKFEYCKGFEYKEKIMP